MNNSWPTKKGYYWINSFIFKEPVIFYLPQDNGYSLVNECFQGTKRIIQTSFDYYSMKSYPVQEKLKCPYEPLDFERKNYYTSWYSVVGLKGIYRLVKYEYPLLPVKFVLIRVNIMSDRNNYIKDFDGLKFRHIKPPYLPDFDF